MENVYSDSVFLTLFPLFLMIAPFIILNGIISERKGKAS